MPFHATEVTVIDRILGDDVGIDPEFGEKETQRHGSVLFIHVRARFFHKFLTLGFVDTDLPPSKQILRMWVFEHGDWAVQSRTDEIRPHIAARRPEADAVGPKHAVHFASPVACPDRLELANLSVYLEPHLLEPGDDRHGYFG